jgi:Spy/CpxP family protein refolding chaperone
MSGKELWIMAVLKKAFYLTIISVVAIAISSWAFAGGPGNGPPSDGPKGPKGLFKILDEDQQETVKAMMEEHREDVKSLREEMENLREELHELIKAEAGEVELNAKVDEIGTLHTEIMKKKVGFHVEVRKLLTDEQKSQLDELEKEMGPHGHMGGTNEGKRHKGGHGPGGRWTEPDE